MRFLTVLLAAVCIFILSGAGYSMGDENLEEAIVLFNKKQYDQAGTVFLRLHDEDNRNPEVVFYLGRIAMMEGEYKKAIQWFEKGIEIKTDDADMYFWLARAASAQLDHAGALKIAGLVKKAKNAAIKATELDSRHVEAHWFLVQYYTHAPGVMGGSTEKAIAHAEAIKVVCDSRGRRALLEIYEKKDDYLACESGFQALIADYPDTLAYRIDLGVLYQKKKFYDKAFQIYSECMDQFPDAWPVWYQYGKTSILAEQNLDEGSNAFRKYIDHYSEGQRPTRDDAYWRLGMIYELKQDKADAKLYYSKALEINPEHEMAKKALKVLNK